MGTAVSCARCGTNAHLHAWTDGRAYVCTRCTSSPSELADVANLLLRTVPTLRCTHCAAHLFLHPNEPYPTHCHFCRNALPPDDHAH